MLAPPELLRKGAQFSNYNELSYDDLDYDPGSDPETTSQIPFPATTGLVQPANISTPIDDEVNTNELEPSDTTIYDHHNGSEEYSEDPIDSQFAPIGDQSHRYVSQHMGGPLATLLVDEPSYFYILTTHLSYMILIAFGRVRDFFGKVFKREKYKGFKEQDGYAALNSDWENFYFRRLKARMNDCFSRPYGSRSTPHLYH
jgi:serine palmitoyltransferase